MRIGLKIDYFPSIVILINIFSPLVLGQGFLEDYSPHGGEYVSNYLFLSKVKVTEVNVGGFPDVNWVFL